MGIDNPTNSAPLPQEIAKKLEIAKEQIAINEQELITLQKARLAEEYAIRELLKQKEELLKIIELEQEKLEKALANLKVAEESHSRIIAENKSISKTSEQIAAEFYEMKKLQEKTKSELVSREKTIKENEDIILKNGEILKVKEEKLDIFVKKLTKVISEF